MQQASHTNTGSVQILHSVGLKFQGQVNEAADLDTVLTLHSDYVSTIFDRCLLNKKVDLGLPALFPPSLPPSLSLTHTHTHTTPVCFVRMVFVSNLQKVSFMGTDFQYNGHL